MIITPFTMLLMVTKNRGEGYEKYMEEAFVS